jgi:SAM-dependent methyltransferase
MVAESKISAESSAMTVLESKTAPSSKGQPDLAPLRAAYKNVDGYQPVYKLEDHFADRSVSRICRDRCAFLHEHIGAESRNLRILDVGCSMGYISLYFAEIGAQVTGLDYQQTNVAFCRILSETLGIKATFERNDFSLELCNSLREGQYDVVFIFSVLHHVINKYGLLATQTMMAELLDKTDVLYVELARNSEDVSFDWKGRLPADELEIFAGIPGLEVERLKDFPALGGTTIRPLYRVRKSAKTFNGIRHLDIKVSRSFIRDGRSSDRKYFVTDHLFTKAFIFSKAGPETYNKFCREVATYHRIAGHPNFLPMLGCEIRGNLGLLTLPHIGSPTLLDELPNGRFRLRQTSIAVISILRALADQWRSCGVRLRPGRRPISSLAACDRWLTG